MGGPPDPQPPMHRNGGEIMKKWFKIRDSRGGETSRNGVNEKKSESEGVKFAPPNAKKWQKIVGWRPEKRFWGTYG